ncbi:zinc ribbon domain-containing protein [Streptomyces sp. NBC_01589]|uniref:zinc ribbon domain-containing protein n=1 Tax=unclassified Streptomyces TaxID=2593676 RepID=UPI003867734A
MPPFHTSQTCAACGRADPQSRKGCGRLFACVHCGHEDDADHNASVEIEGPSPPDGWLGQQQHAQTPLGAECRPPAEADA